MNKIFLALIIVFTSAQALALPLAPEVIDEILLGGNVYNVVIDEIEYIDKTTESHIFTDRKAGDIDYQISVYKADKTEFTRRQANAIFLSTVPVCTRIAKKSLDMINSLEPGYVIRMGADIGHSIDGFLSDDKKTYTCGCKVPYMLIKSE